MSSRSETAAKALVKRLATTRLRWLQSHQFRWLPVSRFHKWCDRLLAAATQLGRSRHSDLVEGMGGCHLVPVAQVLSVRLRAEATRLYLIAIFGWLEGAPRSLFACRWCKSNGNGRGRFAVSGGGVCRQHQLHVVAQVFREHWCADIVLDRDKDYQPLAVVVERRPTEIQDCDGDGAQVGAGPCHIPHHTVGVPLQRACRARLGCLVTLSLQCSRCKRKQQCYESHPCPPERPDFSCARAGFGPKGPRVTQVCPCLR